MSRVGVVARSFTERAVYGGDTVPLRRRFHRWRRTVVSLQHAIRVENSTAPLAGVLVGEAAAVTSPTPLTLLGLASIVPGIVVLQQDSVRNVQHLELQLVFTRHRGLLKESAHSWGLIITFFFY